MKKNNKRIIVVDDMGNKAPEEFDVSTVETIRSFKQRVAKHYGLSGEFNLVTDSDVNLNNESQYIYDQVKEGEEVAILPRGKGGQ